MTKDKLKIALVAPLVESVPPFKYGGSELVVALLARGLKELGHHVTLFASGDSKALADRLVSVIPYSIRSDPRIKSVHDVMILQAEWVRKSADRFDIIHNHTDTFLLPITKSIKTPVVTTFHGKLFLNEQHRVYKEFSNVGYISISKNQRVSMPDLNWLGTVYNGIDINQYHFNRGKRKDYLLFLSRISPEKDPLTAIMIAKATRMKLKLVAKIDPVDEDYFKSSIEPLIDGKQIQLIGEVTPEEKAKFYEEAKALLFTINWPEPFGLVMVEAMASGLPVIARSVGSVPEIVIDGKTGFLRKSIKELAQAVKKIDAIDPMACRAQAEKFSYQKMTQNYLEIYRKFIKAKK